VIVFSCRIPPNQQRALVAIVLITLWPGALKAVVHHDGERVQDSAPGREFNSRPIGTLLVPFDKTGTSEAITGHEAEVAAELIFGQTRWDDALELERHCGCAASIWIELLTVVLKSAYEVSRDPYHRVCTTGLTYLLGLPKLILISNEVLTIVREIFVTIGALVLVEHAYIWSAFDLRSNCQYEELVLAESYPKGSRQPYYTPPEGHC
jgi:hypothetical protein